ncbi:PREDICTED: protein-glutamine gamma-glutamyltransferase 6-like [Nanorana parkeri]|uniref:protein-glutamine gamma-glutamyltransferase 6-like n=1 Tax=Nanorana parkeri TaxID=125878 RepID=UPI0008541570|nr:PREDICTED: protein-glutamine gamma-glutamyltransferase 6-like [Nanorana parkeri]
MTTLQVMNVDLQQSLNATAHRTNEYMTKGLVVRRGQSFTIKVKFNRPLEPADNLKWWTQTGRSQSSSKIILPIPSSGNEKSWSVTSKNNSDMEITINSPADAAIGSYLMGFQVKSAESDVFQNVGGFIMLFNPWFAGDTVYMKDEAERKEYVLNESGIIFYGSATSNPPYRPWDFGQFEEGILDICLKMLDRSIEYRRSAARDVSRRGDPVYVSRILSAMVNSQGDNGAVVGNWTGDYEGGEKPTKWNGSVDILRKWNEGGPVRYGQCWVYGGVLCTVLRCLGIPARVITNFASAHDTDGTLTIDRYIDEKGTEVFDTADSVWNFHVWVEGWFARKDIGSKYDGWQVLDATPQEESEGSFRLGPCSVNAIKEGDMDQPYDTPFVFCEVNGDKIDWLVQSNERRKLRTQTSAIGKFTSTKAVGSNKRVDVTNKYKYPEGSNKEREIFKKAESLMSSTRSRLPAAPATVAFSATNTEPVPKPDFEGAFTQSTDPLVGHDVTFTLVLRSTSSVKINLQLKMTANAIVYTNAPVKAILSEAQTVTLEPKEEKKIPFTITYTQYEAAITTDNMIKAVALCEDEKGGKLLVESVMKLGSQPIVIKATGQAHKNQPFNIEIIFINPLSEDAENTILTVEGSGLVKEPIRIEVPCLKKNQRSMTNFYITPYRSGPRYLLVDLTSEKFSDVKGSLLIEVSSA